MATVLVIDDDRSIPRLVEGALRDSEINVIPAVTAAEGIALIETQDPDVIVLDVMLPDMDGLAAFHEIHKRAPKVPVIFITAGGASDTAIEAMKLGATDYLVKPLELAKVQDMIRQALEIRRWMNVPVKLMESAADEGPGDNLVGVSPQMQEVYKAIGRVAPQDVTVLIVGESGSGKELVARAIYHHSRRADKRFLAVNCAALTETLLESELFGHERGSFTGANTQRIGKFEQCSGGTLFLDEVGDMTLSLQSKVLRVLQEQRFERVGGTETVHTDVRIITATNRNLEKMVADGEFREDLYYRLNGFTIKLPPLRDRKTDLVILLERFLGRFRQELRKDVQGISPDALQLLSHYRWPGNVRQLQNVLRHAMLHATGPVLISEFFPQEIRSEAAAGAANGTGAEGQEGGGPFSARDLQAFVEERLKADSTNLYAESLEMMERHLLSTIMQATKGNLSKAAAILGITRGSVRNKLKTLGISIERQIQLNDDAESAMPGDLA
ncbi:MAG TPA: sigma-54 dependent transcriptional regulator [Pirellulales bacterium]|nr:sigma-54 dependent transcriptional regulator [Pirellulales bacterium]